MLAFAQIPQIVVILLINSKQTRHSDIWSLKLVSFVQCMYVCVGGVHILFRLTPIEQDW